MYIEQREIIIHIGIIGLQGRLDANSAPALKDIWEEYASRGMHSLLVDLHRVEFIDSIGIATLVNGMKQLRSRGGDLKLIGIQPSVRSIFELMTLDKVFTIYASEEEALRGL